MPLRLLQIFIVVFWLGSTAWLLHTAWFADESRFAEVEPERVVRLIFDWKDLSDLAVIESGERIGKMTLAALYIREPAVNAKREFSTAGDLYREALPDLNSNLSWRGTIRVTERMKLRALDILITARAQNLSISTIYNAEKESLKFKVMKGQETLALFDGAPGDLKGLSAPGAATPPMLPMLPFPGGMGGLDGASLQNEISLRASFGQTYIGTRKMPVYLLAVQAGEQDLLKFYVSEAGEILKISTGLGIEAVAEILTPPDLPRRK